MGNANSYDPKIYIHNRSNEPVQVSFCGDHVLDTVDIPPKSTGYVTIPDQPNFNTDHPMNALLNDRTMKVLFTLSGTRTEFRTTYLNAGGVHKENVVITEHKHVSNESNRNVSAPTRR